MSFLLRFCEFHLIILLNLNDNFSIHRITFHTRITATKSWQIINKNLIKENLTEFMLKHAGWYFITVNLYIRINENKVLNS